MENSTLLAYLMKRAEQIKEEDGKRSLSSNYFMAALLQTLAEHEKKETPEELRSESAVKELNELQKVFEQYHIDFTAAQKGIMDAIHAEGYNSYLDEFMFNKICYAATNQAKESQSTEIDTCLLARMILAEPSAAIKHCILEADKPDMDEIEKEIQAFAQAMEQGQKSGVQAQEGRLRSPKKEMPADRRPEPQPAEPAQPELSGMDRFSKTVSDTRRIQKELLSSVFGQDQAVNTFVAGYFQSELMAQSGKGGKKPQATFLFAGPPGVGKTFLAEKVAEALQLPFRRFDMSEYANQEAHLEFCGADEMYRGAKAGNVTGFVAEHPRCVLLFDEIEKAHLNVIYLFLQILDAGRVRDNCTDQEVSFTDTIMIFTTNAGKNLYSDPSLTNLSSLPRKKILKALSTDLHPTTGAPLFPAAICSRFASGNVVMFNHLGASNLYTIVQREIHNDISGFAASTGIQIEVEDQVCTAILLAEGGKADARTVKGRANAVFHEELYELFRLLAVDEDITKKLTTIRFGVDLSNSAPEIAKMFVNPTKAEVLIFADPEAVKSFLPKSSKVVFHVTNRVDEAKELLFNHDITVILCDIHCKEQASKRHLLNAEDIASEGRDFLVYALSRYSMPIHLLQTEEGQISQEEFLSFAKLGVQGMLCTKEEGFYDAVLRQCNVAYQQSNMLKLARENKVLTYKTAQTVSEDQSSAEVTMFDFKLSLATDIDDSKNILDQVSKPNVRFDDVIGAEDAKRELTYFVEYLKDPVKYIRKGVRAPKGVLLYGPPGTGKTLLAKAMAGESDVTFLTAEGNQFLKTYVGEGPQAVHDLFASARKYAPSILFIDEIDAIGKNRGGSSSAEHTGDTLTAFLTEMDGFRTDNTKPVFVLAATNYEVEQGNSRSLDPALLRRFDRRIYVDLPTKEERKRFLHMKADGQSMITLSEEQIENIAVRSTGMSLAELDSVFEMALRNALCTEGCVVDDASFEEAFETFQNGEKKAWSRDSLERTARHEAGHALLCWLSGEKPSYLTIVARGDHGGYMQHGDTEAKGTYTRSELLGLIRTSLAGRAAELMYYGEEDGVSTGPSGDLFSATRTAQSMICRYGMDEEMGLAYVDPAQVNDSDIRKRVNEILERELRMTLEILKENRAAMDRLVAALLEKDHLKADEIDAIFSETVTIQ